MKRPLIIADDKIPFLRGALEPFADISYLPGDGITAADLAGTDALLTRTRTRCDAALLSGSSIRLIATATIGYDHIDTAWCEANGIRWVNAPGCNSSSVQQYITAAILAWAHEHTLWLPDMTLGVIGVGHVGSKVALAGAALGMRVLLCDPPRADREGTTGFLPLDELLRESDIVSCHTPLTHDGPYPTYHLASHDFFGKMKEGAVFINSSRGAVTDTAALRHAIQTKLATCILDVWEGEPDIDPVLLDRAFVATPHIAGYSADGKANGTAACIRELSRFFDIPALANWYPETIPPPPMPTEWTIDCRGKTPGRVLYEAMTHAFPIEEDSHRLKHSPESFEEFRGNYWTRREMDSFTLHLVDADLWMVTSLRSLGFHLCTERLPEGKTKAKRTRGRARS
ncbi:MAG: erythronate-4-phosphate dehydrogenase [Tannerellaceae bacterium]|jgi:erythronate-4-phosphate dehydrogenase|nr:erythronate-4-phosphate dehydrogenase [Tannerellaceae bacterium]